MNLKIAFLSGAMALSVAGCMTPMASNPPPVMQVSTAQFVPMAAASNSFEIESSRLALRRSRNPEVRQFAQQMIRDHNAAGRRMMAALRTESIRAPRPMLDQKHQDMLASLRSSSTFDADYVNAQLMAHQEAVSLFSAYASKGDNATLVEFAQTTLPTLQEHLQHVQALDGGGTRAAM